TTPAVAPKIARASARERNCAVMSFSPKLSIRSPGCRLAGRLTGIADRSKAPQPAASHGRIGEHCSDRVHGPCVSSQRGNKSCRVSLFPLHQALRAIAMARVLIGTSGWHYDSWRGPFFPDGLPLKNQLQYYSSQFCTTELNGVFYRTPTPEAVSAWREQTGKNFVFAWKASKFITHWKRLSQNSVNSRELLEDRLSLLGHKAGPILFQLPPNLEANPD